MSNRMTCPGCEAHTSSVLAACEEGSPCPYCGLSANAILEIGALRVKRADETLKARLEKALVERDRAVAEAARLRGLVEDARRALGCESSYAPHSEIASEPG